MKTEAYVISKIKEQAVVPLFYHNDAMTCVNITKALYEAGIRLIEFTNRGTEALQNFKTLISERNANMPGLLLGAGTIKTDNAANDFIEAGADFLVSPVFDNSVCDTAYMQKILWIPGCMTPTEIHIAEQAGCKLVKLFPGHLLQPAFVSAVKELFPGMSFMPTGGVEATETNLKAWFDAGVCAVGMGSKLISNEILSSNNTKLLKEKATALLNLMEGIKKQ
jgi:2-dehydro-3-deoxyphosphogluconate aldolase/(4S)-4-hydroxy-2-oxoglutarate aldolase